MTTPRAGRGVGTSSFEGTTNYTESKEGALLSLEQVAATLSQSLKATAARPTFLSWVLIILTEAKPNQKEHHLPGNFFFFFFFFFNHSRKSLSSLSNTSHEWLVSFLGDSPLHMSASVAPALPFHVENQCSCKQLHSPGDRGLRNGSDVGRIRAKPWRNR